MDLFLAGFQIASGLFCMTACVFAPHKDGFTLFGTFLGAFVLTTGIVNLVGAL